MVKKEIIITLVLGILIGAAGGLAFYYFSPAKINTIYVYPVSGGTGGTGGTGGSGGTAVQNVDYYWNLITKSLAESSCLKEAKEYAGINAFAVLGCTCSETASATVKNYSCAVSTILGPKAVSVDCRKDAGKCFIVSEYGNIEMTFEQLYNEVM